MGKHFAAASSGNLDKAHQNAYYIAKDAVKSIINIKEHCNNSGASFISIGKAEYISVGFLSSNYLISYPEISVYKDKPNSPAPLVEGILILRYFVNAKGTPLTNKHITFKEIEKAPMYDRTFQKRTINVLLEAFLSDTQGLKGSVETLGGNKTSYGDYSFTVKTFEHVPITFVLYKADDEFEASGSIIFDSGITDYLGVEDIVLVCQLSVIKIMQLITNNNS